LAIENFWSPFVWRLKDVLITIGFTMTKIIAFLVTHELALSTQYGI
jgi:hypothetical protein